MITRKTFTVLTICALSALICALSALVIPDALFPRLVSARTPTRTNLNQTYCRQVIAGTYFLTTSTNGDFAGRRVVTLTPDGNVFTVDSNQNGTQGVPSGAQDVPNNSFTSSQGVWKCTVRGDITATTLNFNFPSPESGQPITTARSDYSATFATQTQMVQGTFTIRTFELTENPLLDGVQASEPVTFAFTGQRVTIRNSD